MKTAETQILEQFNAKVTEDRETLLLALYQTSNKKELLEQFNANLSGAKGSSIQKYAHLLEQIVFFSHAIIFNHGIQTAHNYRQNFMTVAKSNKQLKLSSEEISKAFSFLNRTEAWSFLTDEEKLEKVNERLAKKESERLRKQQKALEEKLNQPVESETTDNKECIAKDEIKRLKSELNEKSYKLARGQKEDDKEAFIKIALVALSTGARLNDIMENLTITTRKGVTYFDDGLTVKKGVILGLEAKTVQSYIKSIRSHYDYIERCKKLKSLLSRTPKSNKGAVQELESDIRRILVLAEKQERGESIDMGTGIRKNLKKLNIAISSSIIEDIKEKNEKLKKPKSENIKYCQNTNHLNQLYRECLAVQA